MSTPASSASTSHLPLQVKVVTSLEEAEKIRAAWSVMQWHPNADIDFYSLIIGLRPEVIRPYVLVVYRGDEPVALLAGRLEHGHFEIKAGYKVLWRPKVRRLTIVYGGLMGQPDAAVNEAIVRRLLQSVREEKADLISWSGVAWKSDLHRLIGRLPGLLSRDYLARASEHWTMKMPSSLEEFLEQKMNKKHRYWAKRTMRVLEKDFPGTVRYACYAKPGEVEKLFADTVAVAKKTYQWGLGVGFQDNEENRRRLRRDAEKGVLRGYLLYLKDEPIAFWLCTVYRDTVHLDFTGYDPNFRKYEVGTALFLRMVGEQGEQGVKHLDFGLGSASYKERFGDASFEETTICVFAPGFKGVVMNGFRLVTQGTSELIRSVLLRLKLEHKIKKLWRAVATPGQAKKEDKKDDKKDGKKDEKAEPSAAKS